MEGGGERTRSCPPAFPFMPGQEGRSEGEEEERGMRQEERVKSQPVDMSQVIMKQIFVKPCISLFQASN